jgi:hypothetical protein
MIFSDIQPEPHKAVRMACDPDCWYFKSHAMRGGGEGIYVRNGLNFKEMRELDDYKLKTFQNIVLEVQYPGKAVLISNVYRSPTPPSQHLS